MVVDKKGLKLLLIGIILIIGGVLVALIFPQYVFPLFLSERYILRSTINTIIAGVIMVITGIILILGGISILRGGEVDEAENNKGDAEEDY